MGRGIRSRFDKIPPEDLPPSWRGQLWFEWEERPGPGPPPTEEKREDEIVIRVQYVECANRKLPGEA